MLNPKDSKEIANFLEKNKILCPQCGNKLEEGSIYCASCGSKQE